MVAQPSRLVLPLFVALAVVFGAPSAADVVTAVESGSISSLDVGVPTADARKKKKRKKRKKKKSKKKSTKKASTAKAAADKKDDAKELRTTGPARLALPVSEKSFDNSAKADRKRDESIEEIRTLLPKVKGPAKGELIFRLAELYWQKSKFVYAKEFKEFDADYQRFADEGHQGKEPKLDRYTKKSEAYKKQALSNYSVVLAKYPDYPRLDEVLYIMAYNEYQAGRKKPAIKNYSQLIRQYPKSEYVPDSYLALGEHYFGSNDLSKATKAFKKAYSTGKKANKPATYRYAQYKLAWCDYNRQEYDKALTKFKAVVTDSEKSGDDDGIQLKGEALNDMVLTYSHLGEVEGAYKYFKKKAGNERAFHLTTKLAQVYAKDGKHKLQVQTLRHLINTDPENPSAPDFQSQIVAAYSQLGERNQVRKEVTRMVELYRPGSAWWRKNEGNSMAVERALTLAESRMRELVTDYHRYAQKFKKYDDYELARDIYAQYLAAFPTSDEAYRLNFFYAEILWDLGEWEKAAEQYDSVVKRDKDGEYTRKCAFNSVLAWEKLSKGEKPPKRNRDGVLVESGKKKKKKGNIRKETLVVEKLKKSTTYEPKKIPRFERKLADACDAYVAVVPESASKKDKKLEEELIQVKFKAGYIFQKYYHFDEAATRFGELIDRWPSSEFAREGADAILDSYASREKYNELEKWSRTFAKNKPLMKDKKFSGTVYKLMEGASFKSIELVNSEVKTAEKKAGKKTPELNEKYAKVADRFEGFVTEFPKSEYAPIALFNAMDIYDGAKKVDLALRDAHRLLKEYPKEIGKGPLGDAKAEQLIRLNLVRYYELIADYEESAKKSVEFVKKYPKHEKSADVLYNAGIFYLGLGDTTNAIKQFAQYIKDNKTKKDVPDVYLKMAKIYEDNKDYKRAIAFYSDFEKKHGRKATDTQVMLTRYKSAELAEKAGRIDEMRSRCEGIIKGYKKLKKKVKQDPITQLAGGYCAFKLLEPQYEAYKAIKIEAGKNARGAKKVMAAIRTQLDLKLKKRDEMAKAYVDVLNYGNGEWGVAGLYRAADALLVYVDALRTAPDPPPLRNNFDALDIFRAELDNIAFPVEDEAINALEKALAKAFELGNYSDYTLAIQEKLRLYRPAKFGEVHDLPFFASSGEKSSQTAQK